MLADYPWQKIDDGIFEINEYDGVSVYLIEGSEKALLIDTGAGIGDLRTFVEKMIHNKPLEVFITHNHRDHVGNAPLFGRIHMSAIDANMGQIVRPYTSKSSRLRFLHRTLETFPDRQYPWTDDDVRDFSAEQEPKVMGVEDGFVFDLGDRQIQCYLVPGHTPGSMALLDSKTHALFTGDCCGQNVGLGVRPIDNPEMDHVSVEEACEGLKRLWRLDFDRDKIFCAHTDYRRFGSALGADMIPRDIQVMEQIIQGKCRIETEAIPILDLSVDRVMVDGISIQFHVGHIFRKS